jgi:hypothetical protein
MFSEANEHRLLNKHLVFMHRSIIQSINYSIYKRYPNPIIRLFIIILIISYSYAQIPKIFQLHYKFIFNTNNITIYSIPSTDLFTIASNKSIFIY